MRIADFDRATRRLDYPTTTTALARRFKGTVLDVQDGSERLDRLFERLSAETFESADELRLSVHGALPAEAVGRRGYSDRDPPALGEVDHVSF